jgi:hypothetical protein
MLYGRFAGGSKYHSAAKRIDMERQRADKDDDREKHREERRLEQLVIED